MDDKLILKIPMMINKITHSVDSIYWFKSLDTASLKPTNQNSIKVPKVFEKTKLSCYFKTETLGTIAIYSPMSTPRKIQRYILT